MKTLSEQKKYTFENHLFELSTDYKKLWNLIQQGNRIPAWIVYTDKYDEPIWDLVEVKNTSMEDNDYDIGTRGISYSNRKGFINFEKICIELSLHFILPYNNK